VQGVGFRWFARESAERLGVSGWVKNLPDGTVEGEAEGEEAAVAEFVAALKKGPAFSRVDDVEARKVKETGGVGSFEIR
jgi:acylphosphatase